MTWYVLAIRSQQHKKIREKLDDIAVESYYPMRTIWRKQRSGPRVRREYPLIPSYLFVACDLTTRSARSILSIDGIMAALGIDGNWGECDSDELQRLRSCEARGDYDETAQIIEQLIVGQSWSIPDGPFAGHVGVVKTIDGSNVRLDVQLFGRTNTIKFNIDNLGNSI